MRAPVFGNQPLGHDEGRRIEAVEAFGDVARELEMLFLVGADRHVIRVVEQDIGRHQARVGEQAGVDVVGVLCGFILELRHAGELAELRSS